MTKICSKCKIEKSIEEFYKDSTKKDGFRFWCKECAKQCRQANKENDKRWYRAHREQRREYFKQYHQTNKEKIRKHYNQYVKEKRKKDSTLKLMQYVSNRIRLTIKSQNGSKSDSTWKHLPYAPQQLKDHLESQFEPWMTWKNYGTYRLGGERKWHIDHIIPQSTLPYDSLEHPNFQKCWALENLRPLEAIENIKKGNKL